MCCRDAHHVQVRSICKRNFCLDYKHTKPMGINHFGTACIYIDASHFHQNCWKISWKRVLSYSFAQGKIPEIKVPATFPVMRKFFENNQEIFWKLASLYYYFNVSPGKDPAMTDGGQDCDLLKWWRSSPAWPTALSSTMYKVSERKTCAWIVTLLTPRRTPSDRQELPKVKI